MKTTKRNAFTLIELLVVIAIIGVLVGLLLPAVQQAREAARRAACINNQKQISMAILNYENGHKEIPVSYAYDRPLELDSNDPRSELSLLTGEGWTVRVLPYLEQDPLYQEFQQSITPGPMGDVCNSSSGFNGLRSVACRPLMQRIVSLFYCPSDPSERITTRMYQWNGIETAATNYLGVLGDNGAWSVAGGGTYLPHPNSDGSERCGHGIECNGLFWRHSYASPQKMKMITDGTSKTLLVGETVISTSDHTVAFFANGTYGLAAIYLNHFPDSEPASSPCPWSSAWADKTGFRSLHNGVVNFAFADGHVESIGQEISHRVYRNLATKNGNEVVTQY